MKAIRILKCLLAAALTLTLPAQAEDIDIFLTPPNVSGTTNIMFVLDSAGSINANMVDIDGVARKSYTVVGNVVKGLLEPATLKVKRTSFPYTSIVTSDVTGCSKAAKTTSACTCGSFGWDNWDDDPTSGYCKLKPADVTRVTGLVNSVNLGVTLFTGKDSNGDSSKVAKGGYIAFKVQPMSVSTNRDALTAKLAYVPTGNASMYSLSMNEVYRYFTNDYSLAGFLGNKAYSSTALEGYDRTSCNKANPSGNCTASDKYVGPVVDSSCTNAVIVIGPGEPDNGDAEKDKAPLAALGGNTGVINGGSKYDSTMFDEYARFFAGKDLNPNRDGVQALQTYTIITEDPTKKINDDARAFMKSAARQGGGEDHFFIATDAVTLIDAIVQVLSKVQAVNSAFASVALPVSVNVRGTNLNQVYIGMFRPDPDANPRWYGNMKEYQLAYDSTTNDVFLASADGTTRAESNDGNLLASNAVSFWTHGSSFWNFAPSGDPKSGSDSPDGAVVEKGGAAQMAREQFSDTTKQATRKVYTCIGCNPAVGSPVTLTDATGTENTAFKDSNTTHLTTGLLGAADATERTNIINWCRGQDLKNENNTALSADASTTDVRASLYGDVLHSKPAVINYNRNTSCASRDDNDVYVFYGSNDGFFKATKGGDNAAATNGGKEQWAFIPEEHLGKLKRLYDNSPAISATERKSYFVDGAIGSYLEYATTECTGTAAIQSVSKAYLFLSMRRGGRMIYALDVTTPTTPKLLWKITNATPGFAEIGETWSEPKSALINLKGTKTPVVIFGGGYDKDVEDVSNATITSANASGVTVKTGTDPITGADITTTVNRSMGRAVYVVNAATGALIWRASTDQTTETCPSGAECTTNADMAYAVPADIGIIDRDRDVNHYADRLYFGDTGANVWRANIGDPDPANWNVYRLASFNQPRGSETAASARRKFLYMPDVVAGPTSDIVLFGSGDREQPFDTSVVNRFYSFENDKDEMTAPAHLITDTSQSGSPLADDLVELNPSDWASGLTIAGERLGWFYTLKGITVAAGGSVTYRAGEKVVSSPVTINGISYFNTNLPTPTACGANLGEARIYALEYLTGKAPVFKNANDGSQASAFLTVPGGGYLPTGVPAVVEVGGKRREVLIAGPKVSQDIGVVQLQRRVRTYWFQGIDQ